ncbi:hypothetical protein HNR46_001696 [Haloferula luteola]|uniref:Uncharacterized protein n=1 Tax=Haloferula luteola TaxID=595692 RepID=A0A840VCD5_9BACT|nr:hypothetical protein [Haloferula luteola]MBB5351459.1 hypothetical protein [Haloferula luteola]
MSDNTNMPRFIIGFSTTPRHVSNIWRQLVDFLAEREALPNEVELRWMTGRPEEWDSQLIAKLAVGEVEAFILERNLNGFRVYSGSGARSFQYTLTSQEDRGCILTCFFEKGTKVPAPWNPLIEEVISKNQCVVASQSNSLYHSWQGSETVDRFWEKRYGEFPLGCKTWSEPFSGPSLTPQPDRVFIDISKNPGRPKALSSVVNFYPTAEMWLGPHFWQYARCTKEEALAVDFFIEKRDTPHYLYLKCWPEPFTRPDGEQGRMQQRLWKLFFHEDCEWPPGSGTICDEPMYGPPELMPGYKQNKST